MQPERHLSDKEKKKIIKALFSYTRLQNRKFYDLKRAREVNITEMLSGILSGDRVYCYISNKEVTKDVLAIWLSHKLKDDLLEKCSTQELIDFINGLPDKSMPSFLAKASKSALKKNKRPGSSEASSQTSLAGVDRGSDAQPNRVDESTSDTEEKKSNDIQWTLSQIRSFYKLKKPVNLKRSCLKCQNYFTTMNRMNRICDNCVRDFPQLSIHPQPHFQSTD